MTITDFSVAPIQTPDLLQKAGQLMQLRALAGEQQMRQQQVQGTEQENQIRQQQINDMNGIHQALNDSGGDPDKLRTALADPKYGISPNGQFSTIKMLNDYKTSQYQLAEADRKNSIDSDNTIADAFNKIKQLPSDRQPSAVQDLKGDSGFMGKLTPEGQQAVASFQYTGPDSLTTMANSHAMRGTLIDQANKEQQTATSAQQQATSAQEQKTSAATEAKTEQETENLKEGGNQALADARYRNIQMAMAQGKPVSPDDKAFVTAYEKQKTLVPQATINLQGNLLKGDALDMAAEKYFQTGELTGLSRSPAMAAAIMKRAAELHPNGIGDLAGNRAAYDANKASYDNVTGTLDTLSAFEQSGLKNLKQFTDLANRLPDTGVPWINTPVRLLNDKLVGAEYMPAVEAARSVALREIARVTNDPKLSGSLTDSARQEVSNFSPINATLPQIKHVVDVLQNDMANVHSSLAQQKADIGTRLGIKPQSTQAGGSSSQSSQPPSGNQLPAPKGKSTVYDTNGVQHFVDSDKLKAFLADPKYKGWHQ